MNKTIGFVNAKKKKKGCHLHRQPGLRSWYSDSLWARQLGLEPWWGGEIFHVHPNRSHGPPSLLYDGYRVSFLGVGRPWQVINHPPPSLEVKERVTLYVSSACGPSWPVKGQTFFYHSDQIHLGHNIFSLLFFLMKKKIWKCQLLCVCMCACICFHSPSILFLNHVTDFPRLGKNITPLKAIPPWDF